MIYNNILEAHYKDHRRALIKRTLRKVGNKHYLAEEAVQEAYTRALKYIHCYDPEKTLDNWLYTILSNSIKDIMTEERNRGLSLNAAKNIPCLINIDPNSKLLQEKISELENTLHKEILSLYIKNVSYGGIVCLTSAPSENMVRKVVSRFKESLSK